ncbi:hypothetical protein BDZ97DRAFT_1921877 [Flammula alnicola]|nr:hypothetical protein BDZ97DRAFT_1921877 [Flammula alnicola]
MTAVGQQAYDISGYKSPMFFAIGGYELSKKIHTRLYYRTKFVGGKQRTIPFPQSTKGVLYYHQPPDDSEGRGQIRFRLCDDVAQFPEGRDLELPNGTPWVWNYGPTFSGVTSLPMDYSNS